MPQVPPDVYAIVQFNKAKGDLLMPIDLVPWIWLECEDGQYLCKYPPKKDLENAHEWIEALQPAEEEWKYYKVKVIASAPDYAKGMVRLNRARYTKNCTSDTGDNVTLPTILDDNQVSNMLQKNLEHSSNTSQPSRKRKRIPLSPLAGGSDSDSASSPRIPKKTRSKAKDTLAEENAQETDDYDSDDKQEKKKGSNNSRRSRNNTSLSQNASSIRASSADSPPGSSAANTSPFEYRNCGAPLNLDRTPSTHSEKLSGIRTTPSSSRSSQISQWRLRSPYQGSNGTSPSQHQKGNKNSEECNPFEESSDEENPHVPPKSSATGDDERNADLKAYITRAITSAKKSILYEFETKTREIKLSIAANSGQQIPKGNAHELRANLGTALPIEKLRDFLAFEAEVKDNEMKKKALTELLQYLCADYSTIKNCIEIVLPKIIRKYIQGEYSGQGKVRAGVSKRDFSATQLFECFEGVIKGKNCTDIDEKKSLKSRIGDWLVHWMDREKGRKDR